MPRVDDYLLNRSPSFPLGTTAENRTDLTLTQSASPTGRVRGRVISSVDGSPIGGVTVKVRTQSGDPVAHTETNNGGNYQIDGIPPGTYSINVAIHGFITPAAQTFTILGGQTLDINFTMTPETRSLNIIYGIVTSNGSGTPILDAKVVLVEQSSTLATTVSWTNASGQYILAEVPDGQYFVSAHAAGYYVTENIPVIISGGIIVETNIVMQPVAVPQATVNGYIKQQNGTPIPDALVGLYLLALDGTEELEQVAFTDASGFYIFGRAVAGTYVVKAKSEKVVSQIS